MCLHFIISLFLDLPLSSQQLLSGRTPFGLIKINLGGMGTFAAEMMGVFVMDAGYV